jgi:hypothetical protein
VSELPMGLLDPHDPKNPQLPLNCPRCVMPLAYLGTLTPDSRDGTAEPTADVHIYRCREHAVFRLTSKGLESDA